MVINCDRQEIILHNEILLQNALKKLCVWVFYTYVCLCTMCVWWPKKPKRASVPLELEIKMVVNLHVGAGDYSPSAPPLPHNSSSRQFELVFFLHSKTQRLLVETEPLIGLLSCKLTSTHLSSIHINKHTHSLSLCNVEPVMSLNKGAKYQRKDSCLIRGVNKTEHSSVADLG